MLYPFPCTAFEIVYVHLQQSQLKLDIFQVFNSHMWLLSTTQDSTAPQR